MNQVLNKICCFVLAAILFHALYIPSLGHCQATLSNHRRIALNRQKSAHANPSRRYARVFNTNFSKLSRKLGLWKGHISGQGLIQLQLVIKSEGQVVAKKLIGSVKMNKNEKPTPFFYRATVPPQQRWSWSIVARAI
jgi:hypothetical protein